jgi:hypothetical protein
MLTTKAAGLLTTIALATLAMAGCSSAPTPAVGSSTTPAAPVSSVATTATDAGDAAPTRTTVTFDDADVPAAKEHCEAYVDFNRRIHAQGQKDVADVDAWTAIYTEASRKKASAPEKFKGLYAVIQVWALELSSTRDGSVKPEIRAELGKAVMGNAGVCTAAGVTLPVL